MLTLPSALNRLEKGVVCYTFSCFNQNICRMETQTIGLFEAKTHLSELVARAEQGGEVIITRHNKPVARIVPLHVTPPFDKARRRAAIAGIEALREELRLKHGSMTRDDIVSLVREGREARDQQILRNATRRKR